MRAERHIRTGIWYLGWRLPLLLLAALCIHIAYADLSGKGAPGLKQVLHTELRTIRHLDEGGHTYRRAVRWARTAYLLVFEATGFNNMIRRFADPRGLNPIDTELRKTVVHFWEEIRAAMISVQLLGERLAMLFSTWPAVLAAALIAAVDGWAAWILRRERADRESAFLYHRLKRGFFLTIVLMWAFYLLPPAPMDPRALLAFILLAAVLLRFTIAYFKKYI